MTPTPVVRPARLVLLLLIVLALPATLAQAQRSVEDEPVSVRPAEMLASGLEADWLTERLPRGDTLTDADLARRIARLYMRQATILDADAAGDAAMTIELLDGMMRDLRQLARRPDVVYKPRFRELYRTVLTEYERQHGPQPNLALDQGDIFELREDMFASLESVRDPLLEDVTLPASMMATFPMTLNRAVENQIRFYLRNNRHVATVRQRAETYFPMIEQILAEEGVPDELKYLAVIESALNPTARSWAGAAGMWQFIPATGRSMGLVVTRDLDERLDPEKATRAAARHLVELYEMFGDWQLAIGGYNMNPYRLMRNVERTSERLGRPATFWDVWNNIPRETRAYIPSFIAVSLLLSNPDAFNLPEPIQGPRYEFDVLPVRGGVTLAQLADRAGTDVRTLQALNPSLRQSRVPASADGFEIRLPVGHYTRNQADLAGFVMRTGVAAPRSVTYQGQNRRVIAFAQPHVPGERMAGPSESLVPVSNVANGLRNGQSVSPEPRTPEVQRVIYRVRRGDTLIRIARRHGVTVNQIRQWNNITGSHIRIGQRLTINRTEGRRS